jgi:glutamate/tyrosine decarboxylase-like PLP-dependent enzyme
MSEVLKLTFADAEFMSDIDHLPWFLGPKGENAELVEDLFLLILRDYIHWRRNYFPGDKILINQSLQAGFREQHGDLTQRVSEMMAEMRRNFPFYNPRYIGHMSSDVTVPSLLGYFTGLLYNPNNVTVEAAPVTVDWEIETTSRILEMLGFNPPPPIPAPDEDLAEYYSRAARKTFGWAHVCSGGTAANIEALWVARNVRYFPISVWDVAQKHNLKIEVKFREKTNGVANGKGRAQDRTIDIRELKIEQMLQLRPNESIYLLARYVEAVRNHLDLAGHTSEAVSEKAWQLLDQSEYGLGRGTYKVFNDFPPVLFVSGAAHYSISKAADVLGIGRRNVEIVGMDSKFRMDVDELRSKIINAAKKGRIPLAVIAIAGTTEEGAVDPVYRIAELRDELETDHGLTFWLHVDAAWGGYIRSLFQPEPDDLIRASVGKIAEAVGVPDGSSTLSEWHNQLTEVLSARVEPAVHRAAESRMDALASAHSRKDPIEYWDRVANLVSHFLRARKSSAGTLKQGNRKRTEAEFQERVEVLVKRIAKELNIHVSDARGSAAGFIDQWHPRFLQALQDNWDVFTGEWVHDTQERLAHHLSKLEKHAHADTADTYLPLLREILLDYAEYVFDEPPVDDLRPTMEDRMKIVHEYVQKQLVLDWGAYQRTIKIVWGKDREVCSAFLAFSESDSITVDPHKMGYTPYPCGLIAFRNDRVRHFILQKAPYITSVKHNALVHLPPKHAEETANYRGRKTVLESFGPFMLEGSKPGAAASGLWLATELIPLTMRKHGAIIRASLLAARELHEWILHWDAIQRKNGKEPGYEFVPLVESDPDTNVVVFVAKRTGSHSLPITNKLTQLIYEQFAIQTELGQRQYSYSQRFFLTKTTCNEPNYPYETLRSFFKRAELETSNAAYASSGLVVLRSVVMSPYLNAAEDLTHQNLFKEFLEELDEAALRALSIMRREEERAATAGHR